MVILKKHYRIKLLTLILLTILSIVLYTFIGINSYNVDYFLPRRLAKIGAILLTSFCIGYTSVTFQTITNNKILTPSVIGLDSLYMFIQTFVAFFFGARQLALMTDISNFLISVILMICSSCLLFILLFKREGKNIYFLVLSGMIFGGLFSGLSNFMQVLLDPNEFLILQGKMFASFNNINNSLLFISFIIVILIFIVTIKDYKKLDVISLGEEIAINLGLNYKKVVLKNLIVTSILVSVSTALTGPISFLGILVVSLSREMLKTYHHTVRIFGAVLLSAFSLIFGQFLMEKVFQFNTTISVIINFIGGAYFIYLMIKEAKA